MSPVNTAALVINSLTILLSLVMLLMLLWQDSRSAVNLAFSIFLIMVVTWASGTLLSRVTALVSGANSLTAWGLRLLEIGFTGSCVGLYMFTLILTGGQGRRFAWLAGVSVALVIFYQFTLLFSSTLPSFTIRSDGTLIYTFDALGTLLYLAFTVATIIMVQQRQRKIKGHWLRTGIYGFTIGILLELISPELRYRAIGMDFSALFALVMSYALVRLQIIDPLSGRANQLQAVRDVGLAITSRLRLEEVLSTIAGQAAGILQADGAAIFLNQGGNLELAAVHNMPNAFLSQRLAIGEGLAGHVAATRQSYRVESYRRDWSGQPDMPFACESFGAVVAAPLIFGDEVMGVLFVVEGIHGKRFDRDDMRLLELLGPQAAVAITNSRLFERQRSLTEELESAKNQLETLLASTDNPVVALDRKLSLIFANPAAAALSEGTLRAGDSLREMAPSAVLPPNPVQTLRHLLRNGAYTYEINLHNRTYLCHLGLLQRPRLQGYVAVLNDITQLKELDRQKNQMIQMTSHQLKNPLFAAMSSLELLQEEGEASFSPEMKQDMSTIWAELQRMNRIIHNILNLERVQSGTLAYEDCSVEQIIRSAVHDYADQALKQGVALQTDIPDNLPVIVANQQFLTQALANLVENAVKFTPSGGQVMVSVENVEEGVVITIRDTGIGIPRAALSRVFERFFRANQPGTDHIRGSGLGLSLVKAVVDAHGGRIWLESEEGKGTTFYLALPVRQSAAFSANWVGVA
jgi:signal transduction histidine kinase